MFSYFLLLFRLSFGFLVIACFIAAVCWAAGILKFPAHLLQGGARGTASADQPEEEL